MKLFAVIFLSLATQFVIAQSKSPNIVLVYFDDLGYGDLSRNGAIEYRTPQMDKLASDGVFFTQFYSPQGVCSASRAGLLTGCYPNRIGISGALDHTSKYGLPEQETTIAEMLKTKGYSTAAFGKWHLGHLPQYLPTAQGFDEFYGIPYSNDMWPNHPTTKNYYPPLPLYQNSSVIETNPDQTQFTTNFTNKTIDFIKKNKNNPFFVYLAHPMPHVPLFVSDKFKGKSKQGLFGDVMMELDWSMGEIRKTLEELKIDNHTLFIITSDNGPWFNYGNHAGNTSGLREGKGTTFEGGQRVPAILYWKGVTPAGITCNQMASAIDILPTIAALTGAKLPEQKIDGVNLSELIKGNMDAEPRKDFYYYYRRNNLEAVRQGHWKLVLAHPGRTYENFSPGIDGQPGGAHENHAFEEALFDLRRDPGERYNVAKDFPEILKQLQELAEKARLDLGDELTNRPGTGRRVRQ
ncbi:MAG: sulfatase [Sphingobacteriales bacterium]|jgi:arylsulfatase A-like enzyme